MSWENRLTVGGLDNDNGEFENNGGDGEDIEVSTDWLKYRTSAEIDDEAGSGVTTYNGSTFCCKIHTAVDYNPIITLAGANFDAAFVVGEWYEVSIDYKVANSTEAKFTIQNLGNLTNHAMLLPSTSWTIAKSIFQVVGNNDMRIGIYSYFGIGEDGTEVLWIDNISILPHRKRRIISSEVII